LSTTPSEVELVARSRRGDVSAMGLLYERYRPGLSAHALSILGHVRHGDIDDVVQDTFLRALGRLHQLQEPVAFGSWLHSILRNTCLQHLRRKSAETIEGLEMTGSGPLDLELVERETREEVWVALEMLPEHLRVTALLRHNGRSYDEIAGVLGIPVGTVRSRLSQARTALKLALTAAATRVGGELLSELEARATHMRERFDAFYLEGDRGLWALYVDDLDLRFSGAAPRRGRVHLESEFLDDVHHGVRLEVGELVYGPSVSVLDATLHNPVHDPYRCPPNGTMLSLHSGGRISRVHIYMAPRTFDPALAS